MEDRRTDRLFFLYDCPRPLLPPRNDRSKKKGRPKSREEKGIEYLNSVLIQEEKGRAK